MVPKKLFSVCQKEKKIGIFGWFQYLCSQKTRENTGNNRLMDVKLSLSLSQLPL